jgi:hypothetical protein
MCQCQDRCPQVDICDSIIVHNLQIVLILIFNVLLALLPPSTFPLQFFLILYALLEPLAEDNEAGYVSKAHTAVIFILLEIAMARQKN